MIASTSATHLRECANNSVWSELSAAKPSPARFVLYQTSRRFGTDDDWPLERTSSSAACACQPRPRLLMPACADAGVPALGGGWLAHRPSPLSSRCGTG